MLGQYGNEIDQMTWSYSRLSEYAQCKYAFYLKYILKDDNTYLQEGNYFSELGSYMHEIISRIIENKLDPDDALEYFYDHYDDNIFYKTKESTMTKSRDLCADYILNKGYEWMLKYNVIGTEIKLDVNIDNYKFVCYIDALLENRADGSYILVDHKSSQSPFSKKSGKLLKTSAKTFQQYKHQMYLYCKAVHDKYGHFPEHIIWNHFKANDIIDITFDQEEYEDAIRWYKSTIHDIENENDYPEMIDYFYCNNLCEFRSCCEYVC